MTEPASALLQIETRCPECGATVTWKEQQVTLHCRYCGSLLYIEHDQEHRFYVEPHVRNEEELRQALILARAQMRRAEFLGRAAGNDREELRLTESDVPLDRFIAELEQRLQLQHAKLLYVPYWHFQATIFQSLLAENQHGVREFHFRRSHLSQALPAYDTDRWNFRDRGLRFGERKLKEVTSDILANAPHFSFTGDATSELERIARNHPPADARLRYTFRHQLPCELQKIPVFRPYWLTRFCCDKTETVLVDGCFGTIAGYPEDDEYNALCTYREKPHAVSATPALKVISSRCPVCGIDTQWGETEILHFCANCGRALLLQSGAVTDVPYLYGDADSASSVYIPFWRFRVTMEHNKRVFSNLKAYYQTFFPERVLQQRSLSDYICIPAAGIKPSKRGDELLAELIAAASGSSAELVEGPQQISTQMPAAVLDEASAREMLQCVLPAASGAPSSVHRTVNLTRMLKESVMRILGSTLVLLPFTRSGSEITIHRKAYPAALMEFR